ncbi:hypothetical protein B0H17DRAFT_1205082 [Mycena rosella]|uniref:Secreted protein n=1 Tax=Mycena rosella TaxID=1033263 RepID=A0AAD7D8C7_MYCRO|nr:hypothetical protein B0H17DRAFT_1205082 [Mycena rosella]
MNTPFSLDGFVLLLHLMITSVRLCAAARGVLNSHDTNGNTPLNLSVENLSFPLAVLADSPEKRHAEGYSVEQILVVSLLVGLPASDALVLPLHQRDDTPPSLPLERAASPAPPPRVLFHDPHEPHRVSFQSPRPSPSSALAHNASQYSLAVSEATCWSAESDAATMVAEPIPGRGFL